MTEPRDPALEADPSAPLAGDAVHLTVVAALQPKLLRRQLRRVWKRAGLIAPGEKLRARVEHVHFRPGTRARLLVRVKLTRNQSEQKRREIWVFLQVHRSEAGARRRFEGITSRPLACLGPPFFLIEDWAAVAWTLPNGPLLRHAKVFFSRKRTRKFFAGIGIETGPGREAGKRPELLRYVPRKRALFRCDPPGHGPLFVKLFGPGEDEPAARNLELLAEAGFGAESDMNVPRLIAHVNERRAVVMANVPGRQLSELVGDEDPGLFRAVGRALGSLHAADVKPVAKWRPKQELGRLRVAVRDLERALPDLEPRLRGLLARLSEAEAGLVFETRRPIHGNLFGDQILVADTHRVGVVDWDDFAFGDPLFDLGRLIAHLAFLQFGSDDAAAASDRRAAWILEGHGAGLTGGGEQRLRWLVAASLIIRAKITALRTLAPDWQRSVEDSLRLAEAVFDGDAMPSLGPTPAGVRQSVGRDEPESPAGDEVQR